MLRCSNWTEQVRRSKFVLRLLAMNGAADGNNCLRGVSVVSAQAVGSQGCVAAAPLVRQIIKAKKYAEYHANLYNITKYGHSSFTVEARHRSLGCSRFLPEVDLAVWLRLSRQNLTS